MVPVNQGACHSQLISAKNALAFKKNPTKLRKKPPLLQKFRMLFQMNGMPFIRYHLPPYPMQRSFPQE